MRDKSIMQDSKRCFVTGAVSGLDCHHIYFGNPNRRISDEQGFWVWLRHDIHMKLHSRQKPFHMLDTQLKMQCQMEFEGRGGKRAEFMRLIGRSYL